MNCPIGGGEHFWKLLRFKGKELSEFNINQAAADQYLCLLKRTTMKIYLAGQLFSEAERGCMKKLKTQIERFQQNLAEQFM